jgi:hypothetical protein
MEKIVNLLASSLVMKYSYPELSFHALYSIKLYKNLKTNINFRNLINPISIPRSSFRRLWAIVLAFSGILSNSMFSFFFSICRLSKLVSMLLIIAWSFSNFFIWEASFDSLFSGFSTAGAGACGWDFGIGLLFGLFLFGWGCGLGRCGWFVGFWWFVY